MNLHEPDCDLCWANNKLEGGHVIAESHVFYTYAFSKDDGSLNYLLIVPKDHHADMRTLPAGGMDEYGTHCSRAIELVTPLAPGYNFYWNQGYVAGQRILNHWHTRVQLRFEGQPASNMGLALLIAEYNKLVEATK